MSANPLAIYDRFDPAKNYDRHLFRADKVLVEAVLFTVKAVPAALSNPPKVALPLTTKAPFLRFKLLVATLPW